MTRVTVVGAGSWGTTFGKVQAEVGCAVTVVPRREQLALAINERHENPDYLPGIPLPTNLTAELDPQVALAEADIVVLAVPAQTLPDNLSQLAPHIPGHAVVVSLMKGIDLRSGRRMSEVIADAGIAPQRIAVVSGPNLAKEIANRQPCATVVGADHADTAALVATSCSTSYFRPYTQSDVVGIELAGSVKNVIALAVGIAEGQGFGHNTQAALITRGLAETARLAAAYGAEPNTLAGLAGMGDLVATCNSPLSRNRTVGVLLGQGNTLEEIMSSRKITAEGVKSCGAISALAHQKQVEMPIVEHISAALSGELAISQIANSLLGRPIKAEDRDEPIETPGG